MKLNYLFVLLLNILCVSCSNSGGESADYILTQIGYENFTMYVGTAQGGIAQNYDTILTDRNTRLQDTTKLYFSTVYSTFEKSNDILFEFLDDNKMKFIDYNAYSQFVANKMELDDSIFILKNNLGAEPVFVVREDMNKQYYRTLSAFRYIYTQEDGERKDSVAIVEGVMLDADYLLHKFNLSGMDQLAVSDTLIWINVDYAYH